MVDGKQMRGSATLLQAGCCTKVRREQQRGQNKEGLAKQRMEWTAATG